ncbi:organic hydroperoxide resistance protein [Gymnodinialimonas sp. 2305UL16-5]|uniref:organic hydroperoxide resistance protein n=1 Tax=Gymnodinialimonas mytili TaxID=3126503 RepID=UPI00309965AE
MSIKPVYVAHATATGGRDGRARTEDGSIDLKLAPPVELGGDGKGNNPEQLFAAGYAACYIGAMKFAQSQDASLPAVPEETSVTAQVGIGPREDQGFGLQVILNVSLPGVSADDAARLTQVGHGICPYSHATQGNIDVVTNVV